MEEVLRYPELSKKDNDFLEALWFNKKSPFYLASSRLQLRGKSILSYEDLYFETLDTIVKSLCRAKSKKDDSVNKSYVLLKDTLED